MAWCQPGGVILEAADFFVREKRHGLSVVNGLKTSPRRGSIEVRAMRGHQVILVACHE